MPRTTDCLGSADPSIAILHRVLFYFDQFSFVNLLLPLSTFETWSKINVLFSSSDGESRINDPTAGRPQRGLPGAPPTPPPHQLGVGWGRGFAETVHSSGPVSGI